MNEDKLRVGIVDDEFLARQTLINYIARYCSNVEVVFQAANLPDAITEINRHRPDAVFLDIEMPGPSGIDIAEHLSEEDRPMVVFTTAYGEYAVDAFGIRAVDYLLKPIEVARLKEAVERLREQRKPSSTQDAVLNVSTLNGSKIVPIDEILYLKADGSYTELHSKTGTTLVISKKLFEMEEKLTTQNFLRTHRSYIVNMNHVTQYVGGAKSELVLSSDDQVPVSRTRKDQVRSFIGKI